MPRLCSYVCAGRLVGEPSINELSIRGHLSPPGLFPFLFRPVSCIQADAGLRVMPSLSEPVRAEPTDRAEARHRAHRAPQLERAWDAWQAARYQRGEISQRPGYADSPFRPR